MSEKKTEIINLRITPRVKEMLRLAASQEHRTLSNMLEVLIEGYFDPAASQPAANHPVARSAPSKHGRAPKRASHR